MLLPVQLQTCVCFMWQEHQSVPAGLDRSHGVHRPHHAAQHGEVKHRRSPAHRHQSRCADRPIVCLFIKQTHQLIGCKSAAPPPPPHFTNLPLLSSPPALHPYSTPPLTSSPPPLLLLPTSFTPPHTRPPAPRRCHRSSVPRICRREPIGALAGRVAARITPVTSWFLQTRGTL